MTTRYGKDTTTDELLEGRTLSGRRMLITGGTSGLGLETARVLAAHGADVVITARDADKAERAVATIRAAAAPGATVEVRELDLASLASVHACADQLLAEGQPIHVLFANAGVMACPQGRTREGFETQIDATQLCPTSGPRGQAIAWKNHGQYVSCVSTTATRFHSAGYITAAERSALTAAAAQATIGKK